MFYSLIQNQIINVIHITQRISSRFDNKYDHKSLFRNAISALFHGTVQYANTKRQSLINCSALICCPKMQNFLLSLNPTLDIKQWVYEEQKKKASRYRPAGKVLMEKLRAQLVEITGKTPNSLKHAQRGEDESSLIDINAINSKGNTLSEADHTTSPRSPGSLSALSADSSCGSIRWVHVFLNSSLSLHLCRFVFSPHFVSVAASTWNTSNILHTSNRDETQERSTSTSTVTTSNHTICRNAFSDGLCVDTLFFVPSISNHSDLHNCEVISYVQIPIHST